MSRGGKAEEKPSCQEQYRVGKVVTGVLSLHFRNIRADIGGVGSAITDALAMEQEQCRSQVYKKQKRKGYKLLPGDFFLKSHAQTLLIFSLL